MTCSYCGTAKAIHSDHIFSRALRRRFPAFTDTVPSCAPCNWRKGTSHFVPPSWESRIPELEELTGKKWAVFTGDPKELTEVLR